MLNDKDYYYLDIAKTVASRSTCFKKHYGALIVNSDMILATGYNGTPAKEPHCVRCTKKDGNKDMDEYCSCLAIHAEQNALLIPAKKDMFGATLYLTGFDIATQTWIDAKPCEICLRMIKNSGIAKIVNQKGVLYKRNINGILEKVKEN